MNKYITMFLTSAPILFEKINTALAVDDFTCVADQFHGFKTKFIMMCMKNTGIMSVSVEQQYRSGSASQSLVSEIRGILVDIEQAICELS